MAHTFSQLLHVLKPDLTKTFLSSSARTALGTMGAGLEGGFVDIFLDSESLVVSGFFVPVVFVSIHAAHVHVGISETRYLLLRGRAAPQAHGGQRCPSHK